MATVANPRTPAHPVTPSGDIDDLIPIAVQLVGCVHDHEPAAAQRLLASVDGAKLPTLALALAAMVNPECTPAELLAWRLGPPRSLEGTDWDVEPAGQPWGRRQAVRRPCPHCGEPVQDRHMARHLQRRHETAEQVA